MIGRGNVKKISAPRGDPQNLFSEYAKPNISKLDESVTNTDI
jgi:hypothetical protein